MRGIVGSRVDRPEGARHCCPILRSDLPDLEPVFGDDSASPEEARCTLEALLSTAAGRDLWALLPAYLAADAAGGPGRGVAVAVEAGRVTAQHWLQCCRIRSL